MLVGDPDYYARFGFAGSPGLVVEGVPAANVLALAADGAVPAGAVAFHPAFGVGIGPAEPGK